MMARATGAFLATLIGLGYLAGDFTSGTDLLVVLVVSLAVAVAVAYWLERAEPSEPPDVFDAKATRRAVRRGTLRTALVAIVWVSLAFVAVGCASTAWQTRGDRDERAQEVVRYGVSSAYPGLTNAQIGQCCPTGIRSLRFDVEAEVRSSQRLAPMIRLPFELDLRGRLGTNWLRDVPRTPVDVATESVVPKRDALRLIERLPESVVATAVVELARPLDVASFQRLLVRHEPAFAYSPDLPVYLEPSDVFREPEGTYSDRRVSWPRPSLAEFQAWVKRLRSGEDELLDVVGLPGRERLRELAAAPRIHAFVLDEAPPTLLRSLLRNPAVSRLGIGEVAFDLSVRSEP